MPNIQLTNVFQFHILDDLDMIAVEWMISKCKRRLQHATMQQCDDLSALPPLYIYLLPYVHTQFNFWTTPLRCTFCVTERITLPQDGQLLPNNNSVKKLFQLLKFKREWEIKMWNTQPPATKGLVWKSKISLPSWKGHIIWKFPVRVFSGKWRKIKISIPHRKKKIR